MTTKEFSIEFDILYNNISSNAAPGLNEYEKSIFLTRAQEELVMALYSGNTEGFGSFESNTELRTYLTTLVKNVKIDMSTILPNSNSIVSGWTGSDNYYDYVFDLAALGYKDILYIVYEAAKFKSSSVESNKIDSLDVEVKAIKHDEYHSIVRNPFRKPNENRVLRVDSNLLEGGNEAYTVELISSIELSNYILRYIREPKPIILETLTSYNVSINIK